MTKCGNDYNQMTVGIILPIVLVNRRLGIVIIHNNFLIDVSKTHTSNKVGDNKDKDERDRLEANRGRKKNKADLNGN